jgi:hypothetical protein
MNFYYEICQTKKLHLNSEPNDQSGFWIKIYFYFRIGQIKQQKQ